MTAREEFELLRNEIGAINHALSNVTYMSAVDYELIECVIKDLQARKTEAGNRLYAEMKAAAEEAEGERAAQELESAIEGLCEEFGGR